MKRSLEGIRDLARSRVRLLNEGETGYTATEKAAYLRQYESKLRELDHLLHELGNKPIRPPQHEKSNPSTPRLKTFFRRLME